MLQTGLKINKTVEIEWKIALYIGYDYDKNVPLPGCLMAELPRNQDSHQPQIHLVLQLPSPLLLLVVQFFVGRCLWHECQDDRVKPLACKKDGIIVKFQRFPYMIRQQTHGTCIGNSAYNRLFVEFEDAFHIL